MAGAVYSGLREAGKVHATFIPPLLSSYRPPRHFSEDHRMKEEMLLLERSSDVDKKGNSKNLARKRQIQKDKSALQGRQVARVTNATVSSPLNSKPKPVCLATVSILFVLMIRD